MQEEKETFETVLQSLIEMRKSQKAAGERIEKEIASLVAAQKETDRIQKENERFLTEKFAETDKQRKENEKVLTEKFAETREQIRNLSININGISDSNGLVAEQTICNALEQNMTFAGIEFDDLIPKQKRHSKKLNLKGEFDVILENGDTIALIEVKYKVRKSDVSKLATEQIEKFRKLFPKYSDYKIISGVGGMSFEDDAIKEAEENGVGIIKIVGNKVEFYTEKIKIHYNPNA